MNIREKVGRFLQGPVGYLLLCYFLLPPPIQERLFMRRTYLSSCAVGVGVIIYCLCIGKIRRRNLRFAALMGTFLIWLAGVHFVLTRGVHLQTLNTLMLTLAVFALSNSGTPDTRIKFWRYVYYYTSALVVLNLATQVFWPAGFSQGFEWASWQGDYLLNNPNSFIFYYILPLTIDAVMTSLRGAKVSISFYVLAALEILSFRLCGDASSTTGLMLVAFIVLVVTIRDVPRFRTALGWLIRNLHWVLLAGVLGFVILVCLNSVNVLLGTVGVGQDDIGSFAYRMEIWKNALREIVKAPVMGHGMQNLDFSFSSESGGIERSAHNNYLQILYYGGIVALALYVALIAWAVSRLQRLLAINSGAAIAYAAGLVAFLMAFLVEQNPFATPYYDQLIFSLFLADYAMHISRAENVERCRAWPWRIKKGIIFLAI